MVVLRDRADPGGGIEVYLVKRSRMVDFMAGAHVFPGGRLDKADDSRWLRDEMLLAPATAKCLDALLAHRTVDEALATAAKRLPPVAMPQVWSEDGRAYISLPGDPRHPITVDPLGGKILRLKLEAGRYRPVKAA